jgi:hypothetical protein
MSDGRSPPPLLVHPASALFPFPQCPPRAFLCVLLVGRGFRAFCVPTLLVGKPRHNIRKSEPASAAEVPPPGFLCVLRAPSSASSALHLLRGVMIIDANVARKCIQEALIDEIRVHLAPILLGDGVRFFHWPAAPHAIRLEPTEFTQSGQVTNFRFRFSSKMPRH